MDYCEGIVKNAEFFTTAELAEKLKMNVQVITRKVQAGEIKAYKIGKDWRIPENAVHQWLESKSNQTSKNPLVKASKKDSRLGESKKQNEIIKKKPSDRKYLLEYILAQFEPNMNYTEEQVNRIIGRHHNDSTAVRKEFLTEKMMNRTNGHYRRRAGYKVTD